MRRFLLGGLVAATLGLPAAALAKQATGVNTTSPTQQTPNVHEMQQLRDRNFRPHDQPAHGTGASIGGGMDAGNEIGHTTGPGNAPIDNSTRGPLNDVTPGQGSADTHQSKNPKPIQ